jgi:hypothetical protein
MYTIGYIKPSHPRIMNNPLPVPRRETVFKIIEKVLEEFKQKPDPPLTRAIMGRVFDEGNVCRIDFTNNDFAILFGPAHAILEVTDRFVYDDDTRGLLLKKLLTEN